MLHKNLAKNADLMLLLEKRRHFGRESHEERKKSSSVLERVQGYVDKQNTVQKSRSVSRQKSFHGSQRFIWGVCATWLEYCKPNGGEWNPAEHTNKLQCDLQVAKSSCSWVIHMLTKQCLWWYSGGWKMTYVGCRVFNWYLDSWCIAPTGRLNSSNHPESSKWTHPLHRKQTGRPMAALWDVPWCLVSCVFIYLIPIP